MSTGVGICDPHKILIAGRPLPNNNENAFLFDWDDHVTEGCTTDATSFCAGAAAAGVIALVALAREETEAAPAGEVCEEAATGLHFHKTMQPAPTIKFSHNKVHL